MKRYLQSTWQFEAVLIIGSAILVRSIFSWMLRDWQIDDAGITFAYARNVAAGYGFVSQPGFEPVEGFSNPTWLFLCVICMKLGIFEASFTAKLLAALCMALTHFLAFKLVREVLRQTLWVTIATQILLATNASLAIWTNSGLENSLFALLVIGAGYALVALVTAPSSVRAVLFGLLAGLLALTRPDGVILVAALPLALTLAHGLRLAFRVSLIGAAPFILLFGSYLVFRQHVFGEWVPNTAIMKGGPHIGDLARAVALTPVGSGKLVESLAAVFAFRSVWLMLLVCLLFFRARSLFADARFQALGVLAVLAIGEFLILPWDWMSDQRFATPMIVVASLLLPAVLFWQSAETAPSVRMHSIGLLVLAGAVVLNIIKFAGFVPQTSLNDVAAEARRINAIALELRLPRASLLTPDMGGALLESKLPVYDLLGLTDKRIARTIAGNKPSFYDYVFEEIRPTLIHTMEDEDYLARMEDDPRFLRDYQLLLGDWVPSRWRPWSTPIHGAVLFVRKDAIADRRSEVNSIQQRYGSHGTTQEIAN